MYVGRRYVNGILEAKQRKLIQFDKLNKLHTQAAFAVSDVKTNKLKTIPASWQFSIKITITHYRLSFS
jgi:hypothetical protein